MKALVLKSFGDRPSIEYKETQLAEPGDDEVLVKIAVTPINPSDLILLGGQYPMPRLLPLVPGFEGSGTVIKSGKGDLAASLVTKRVACRATPDRDGTWAQYAIAKAERCIPLQSGVSIEQGAMLLVNPLTAWALVHAAQLDKHKCAIQTAAASALGKMVIRLAKEWHFPLINVVRSNKQVQILKDFGAEHVLNSSDSEFQLKLKELASELSATVAFDAIAGEMSGVILTAMPNGSELWCYGGLSNEPCRVDPMVLVYQTKTLKGFWGPPYVYKLNKSEFDSAIAFIQSNLEGIFRTEIRKVYEPGQFKEALADYKGSMGGGKVLFAWEDSK